MVVPRRGPSREVARARVRELIKRVGQKGLSKRNRTVVSFNEVRQYLSLALSNRRNVREIVAQLRRKGAFGGEGVRVDHYSSWHSHSLQLKWVSPQSRKLGVPSLTLEEFTHTLKVLGEIDPADLEKIREDTVAKSPLKTHGHLFRTEMTRAGQSAKQLRPVKALKHAARAISGRLFKAPHLTVNTSAGNKVQLRFNLYDKKAPFNISFVLNDKIIEVNT